MKVITASRGEKVLVDDEDYKYLSTFKWHVGGKYVRRGERINGVVVLFRMHRQLLNLPHSDKRQVDHINGNRLDNRKSNLRICTPSENSCNRKRRCDNKSGFKGVHWDSKSRKWRASISKDGKTYHLGLFDRPEAARDRYQEAAKIYHKEFSYSGERNEDI